MSKEDEGPVEGAVFFPPVTPEQLFKQDKRRMDWDERERKLDREIAHSRARFPELWADRDRVFE